MPSIRQFSWFPSDAPTWVEVIVGIAAASHLVGTLPSGPVRWPWFAVGFAVLVLATGPGANSALGARVGAWFSAIGVTGRVLAILGFAGGVWLTDTVVGIPEEPTSSIVAGVMAGVVVFIVVSLLAAGEVDGWSRNRE